MKRINLLTLLALLFLSACETGGDELPLPAPGSKSVSYCMTCGFPEGSPIGNTVVTKTNAELYFYIIEPIVIDWGDGTSETLPEPGIAFHTYTDGAPEHSVSIYGTCKAIQDFGSTNSGLESFDFKGSYELKIVEILEGNIETLDFSYNPKLTYILCENLNLKKLIFENYILSDLTWIRCASNQLTSLDLSNLPNLEDLDCSQNNLTSLNVSRNTKLRYLGCGNNPFINNPGSLASFANSLPDRTGEAQGELYLGNAAAADAIRPVCISKNWKIIIKE